MAYYQSYFLEENRYSNKRKLIVWVVVLGFLFVYFFVFDIVRTFEIKS